MFSRVLQGSQAITDGMLVRTLFSKSEWIVLRQSETCII